MLVSLLTFWLQLANLEKGKSVIEFWDFMKEYSFSPAGLFIRNLLVFYCFKNKGENKKIKVVETVGFESLEVSEVHEFLKHSLTLWLALNRNFLQKECCCLSAKWQEHKQAYIHAHEENIFKTFKSCPKDRYLTKSLTNLHTLSHTHVQTAIVSVYPFCLTKHRFSFVLY